MKKIYFQLLFLAGLILICLVIGIHQSLAQTIRVANNNPDATPGVNVYTGSSALQNALGAAVSGDIIYVTPSPTSYGNITITDKQLTIYGVGLNPDKDLGLLSIVGTIAIMGDLSSGTRLSGLDMGALQLVSANAVEDLTLTDVTVDNCRLTSVRGPEFGNRLENLLIRNCIFDNGLAGAINIFENVQNILITNNLIRGSCCTISSITAHGTVIQHNLIHYRGDGWTAGGIHHCSVQNNIYFGTGTYSGDLSTYSVYRNNLIWESAETTFAHDDEFHNMAYDNINADPLFVNIPVGSSALWSFEWDFHLLPGSPAIGAATDGTDIGPTGGPFPFDYEGTFLPLIKEIIIPGVIQAGQDLQITIKAKGN